MSLRMKSVVIIFSTLVVAYLVLLGLVHTVLIKSLLDLEEQTVTSNINRVENSIDHYVEQIKLTCTDYSAWDYTYEFVVDPDQEYVDTELMAETYENISVNLIMIYDLKGQPVYTGAYDLDSQQFVSVPVIFSDLKSFDPSILTVASHSKSKSGIVNTPQGLLMLAACPILDGNREMEPRGVMLMGRYLDDEVVSTISEALMVDFSIREIKAMDTSLRGLLTDDAAAMIAPISDQQISGYKMMPDWHGAPAAMLKANFPRPIYQEGLDTLRILLNVTLITEFFIALVILLLLERSILSRIIRLSKRVNRVGRREMMLLPADPLGQQDDEIGTLTLEINQMLQTIQRSQSQFYEGWQYYKQLFNESFTANFIADQDGSLLLYNSAFMELFKLDTPQGSLQINLFNIYPGPDQLNKLMDDMKNHATFSPGILDLNRLDGSPIKVMSSARGMYNQAGELIRIQGFLLDITELQHAQEVVRYLSHHDNLTGLYNRDFIEDELIRLEKENSYPYSVIMVDVNGLKMINDTLGHEEGDNYLIGLAAILERCCRPLDMIARWGGDEFLILLPQSSENVALNISRIIQEEAQNESSNLGKISISLGIGCADHDQISHQDVISQAEERMYRNKLLQSSSNLHALISSLRRTLWAKSNETEEHARRLARLVTKVGRTMDLTQNQMDELNLLATLHDIGKIAVPDDVLEKAGPLTPAEWELIKKHSEIGYRIAQFSPEMAPIAEAILAHHERWDGQGYPIGLKGSEIPIIARILSIADAYDVMTNERPYKKPISHLEAVEELRRSSGTQFDPELIDIFIASLDLQDGPA